MRRSLAWLACGTGALFAFRWLRLRRRKPAAPAADPAEELRRKLEETRIEPGEPAEPAEQAAPEPAPAEPGGVDERRREVHERGRAAIDRMRGEQPGDPE